MAICVLFSFQVIFVLMLGGGTLEIVVLSPVLGGGDSPDQRDIRTDK